MQSWIEWRENDDEMSLKAKKKGVYPCLSRSSYQEL